MFLEEDAHLADVQEALHGTDPKWWAIGIQLRIPGAKLEKIEHQYSNLEDRNRQMQVAWLKTGKATWTDLVKALRKKSVGLPEVAGKIHGMHCGSPHDHHTVPREVESSTESLLKTEKLGEILEWLLKMGFTVEEISKWVNNKRKSQPPSTSGDQAATNQSTVPISKEKPKVQSQSRAKKRNNVNRTKQSRAKRSRSEGVTAPATTFPAHRSSVDSGTKRLKRKDMLEKMMTILKELEKIDEAEEFIDRVEKEIAEDYDDIIETQMYLTRMKQKVKCGDYDTPQEFLDDFDLIISNCEEYNGLGSDMMEDAKKLEAKFKELCSEYLPDDDTNYSKLEKIPSDADSSEESEESTRGNISEQEGEQDQSLSTVIGEDDQEWTDSTPEC